MTVVNRERRAAKAPSFVARATETFVVLADRAVPPGVTDLRVIHRIRAAIAQSTIGVVFTVLFGTLYTLSGSPWSGAAILLITAGLLAVPSALRRNVSLVWIGNGLIALTWLATFVVASRSGGFSSPAVVWTFLFPLATYAVCGRRSAHVWSFLSGLQVVAFFLADIAGVPFARDFTPRVLSVLRVSGYAGVIATVLILLSVIEAARRAAFDVVDAENRARERTRILNDMHDGVGSQLLGLMIQLRGGVIDSPRIINSLERCIDDLRLIVSSLDNVGYDFEHVVGELRARVEPRFSAAGIELRWNVDLGPPAIRPDGVCTMQSLRALQEMLSNALRHSGAARVDVSIALSRAEQPMLDVCVRDYGSGFDPSATSKTGRGLKSLRTRAERLGGTLEIRQAGPGALVCLRVPTERDEPSSRATCPE